MLEKQIKENKLVIELLKLYKKIPFEKRDNNINKEIEMSLQEKKINKPLTLNIINLYKHIFGESKFNNLSILASKITNYDYLTATNDNTLDNLMMYYLIFNNFLSDNLSRKRYRIKHDFNQAYVDSMKKQDHYSILIDKEVQLMRKKGLNNIEIIAKLKSLNNENIIDEFIKREAFINKNRERAEQLKKKI